MLTPNKITLDLSAISETLEGKMSVEPAPKPFRTSTNDYLTILPNQNVGIATIGKGIYAEIHLLKLDEKDVSGETNPRTILDSIDTRSVATMYVSAKSKHEANSFIFDKRTGSPAVNATHEFYRERLARHLDKFDSSNPLFFKKALAHLNANKLIDNSYIPSPEKIESVILKKNPLKPATRMDILQTEELVDVGQEKGLKLTFKILESWSGGNSYREIEDRKNKPRGTIETTIRLSNSWTKDSISASYIDAIKFAADMSINFSNNLDTFSVAEGVDSEFKVNLDTVLQMRNLKQPSQWKASFAKRSHKETTENDIPLIYFADAIVQLGLADVVDEGSGGGLQTVYRFKSKQTTASEKVKFCSHAETAQAIDRINSGEQTKFVPNRGLSVSRGHSVKGGKKFISHLTDLGVISDPDAYSKCVKVVKALTKGQDFTAITKASKSAGIYHAPLYPNSVQKHTHESSGEIFNWRGVSDKVKQRLLNQNVLGTSWFVKFGRKRPCLVVNLVDGIGGPHVAQQELYIDKSKEKWKLQKPFYKNANREGTASVLPSLSKTGKSKAIVFTEAFVDMCSAYDVLDAAGLNPDDYTFASALSSTTLNSWLAASTGGYRPASERELKFKPDVHVYKDIKAETEITEYDEKVKKVQRLLEPLSPLNFHDNGSEGSKNALSKLQKLVNIVNKNSSEGDPKLEISVVKKEYRDAYHHPNSKANDDGDFVFNDTNTDNFLTNSGVIFGDSGKVDRIVDIKPESVEVTEKRELSLARREIVEKLGTDKLVAYHDTDVAGLKGMPAFGKFITALQLKGNVLTLPYVSENDLRMNTADVNNHLIKHCHELIDYKLDAPINDINDLSKFLNKVNPNTDAHKECIAAIQHSVTADYSLEDEKRLMKALEVLPLLEDAISKEPLAIKTFAPNSKRANEHSINPNSRVR